MSIIEELQEIYGRQAGKRYGLAAVSQLQHALQSAVLAEAEGGTAGFVTAALLHDVGHMIHGLGENAARAGVDDTHEKRAARWLAGHFGPEVTEPIRLHVDAKRYLCVVDPTYLEKLAEDSLRSLVLQGGPLTSDEAAIFETRPYFAEAVRLRRVDDRAKVPDATTPPFDYFLPCLEAALSRTSVA